MTGPLRGINGGFDAIIRLLEGGLSSFEPFMATVLVPADKAGLVVGTHGAVIRDIKAKSGVDDIIVGNRDDIRRIGGVFMHILVIITIIIILYFHSLKGREICRFVK